MFTSSADVFRTRQAVRDLVEVVRTHRAAIERTTDIGPALFSLDDQAVDHGFLPSRNASVVSDLLFGAATPDDDFNAFVGNTALLIADRLQLGQCEDDLYWNWDAFRDHYKLADPPVRAALMNGFRTMHVSGLVNLDSPPSDADCFTYPADQITPELNTDDLKHMLQALQSEISGKDAGRLWAEVSTNVLSWPLKVSFRYLYERPESIVPEEPHKVALIPWA